MARQESGLFLSVQLSLGLGLIHCLIFFPSHPGHSTKGWTVTTTGPDAASGRIRCKSSIRQCSGLMRFTPFSAGIRFSIETFSSIPNATPRSRRDGMSVPRNSLPFSRVRKSTSRMSLTCRYAGKHTLFRPNWLPPVKWTYSGKKKQEESIGHGAGYCRCGHGGGLVGSNWIRASHHAAEKGPFILLILLCKSNGGEPQDLCLSDPLSGRSEERNELVVWSGGDGGSGRGGDGDSRVLGSVVVTSQGNIKFRIQSESWGHGRERDLGKLDAGKKGKWAFVTPFPAQRLDPKIQDHKVRKDVGAGKEGSPAGCSFCVFCASAEVVGSLSPHSFLRRNSSFLNGLTFHGGLRSHASEFRLYFIHGRVLRLPNGLIQGNLWQETPWTLVPCAQSRLEGPFSILDRRPNSITKRH